MAQKGQAATSLILGVPIVIVTLLAGYLAINQLYDKGVPHDKIIHGETLCSGTCSGGTLYPLAYTPFFNDTDLTCRNSTGAVLVRGGDPKTSFGFNVNTPAGAGYTKINLTFVSNSSLTYHGIVCTYEYDWANANEQGFYDSSMSNVSAGFSLGAVAPLVIAAVAVVAVVFLLRSA